VLRAYFLFAVARETLAMTASPLLTTLNQYYLEDEQECMTQLVERARLNADQRERVALRGRALVQGVRGRKSNRTGLDAFLRQYDLSSQEGVILMCLAEALLRIPDDATADKLIADKIVTGDWASHLGEGESLFVNASTWGLLLTGAIVRPAQTDLSDPRGLMARIAGRLGEPVLRGAFRQAMRIMGHQFVMGRTMQEALQRAASAEHRAYRHSFDMLGEAALTSADAQRYFTAYREAILALAAADIEVGSVAAPSISVKLSALFPRYEFAQAARVHAELGPRLLELAQVAHTHRIALTIDAEEAERLELSLQLIESLARAPALEGWQGLGLAVQAYQKRALAVVRWVVELARSSGRRLNVRLVKGAYWDTEIKRAQERGLAGYPVFTRKVNTDVSYLACARELLSAGAIVYPQFATHNAHTVATVLELAGGAAGSFEFQRLHGMGEELYAQLLAEERPGAACRIYAPVGSHEDLLPYLVRRLLENGANTSFVNRIIDERLPVDRIVADPIAEVDALQQKAHPRIPLPRLIFGSARLNSFGINLPNPLEREPLLREVRASVERRWHAVPLTHREVRGGEATPVLNPARRTEVVGSVRRAEPAEVTSAIDAAVAAQPQWNAAGAVQRAAILTRAGELFEAKLPELVALVAREGGRCLPDAIAEVREAVDFLRYYAHRVQQEFDGGQRLPGPTGESNELHLHGRGVFVCISPWNFPLAIFTGQIAAALAAGNSVIAKPAEQTPLVAHRAVQLLLEAGVPREVLHCLPGRGSRVGAQAVADPRIAGVVFTGSTDTAQLINRTLAQRSGAIATLIAETGGQNAMIVDSSALPEQVVLDVVQSGFNSAGQRCSALRVLFVQQEIAPRVQNLLAGYMDELTVGDPLDLATDVGPVIDPAAQQMLQEHSAAITRQARWQHTRALQAAHGEGCFVAPLAVEIDSLAQLPGEVFGPIVHVVRYQAHRLDQVIEAINGTGYGLTLGIHTRVDSTARYIASRVRAGNVYVNRNMIGAVVGVQPFGGRGLSGTGPKAGGPYYLHRFATEQTITNNTAAVGGNASLLTISE
jgi:RHH-type proline utilization regulon transcriptional repressor/proline dehydrogenase/delta 1-pyrroline-5-carboxylate dehydrogenase